MSDSTNKVVASLAAYWRKNSAACDTAEGMHRWWFGGDSGLTIAEVEDALQRLMEQGLIERRFTGMRAIFRLRADGDAARLAELAQAAESYP